jgi:hypothetical protein
MSDRTRYEELLAGADFKKFDRSKGDFEMSTVLVPGVGKCLANDELPFVEPEEPEYPYFTWVGAPESQKQFRMTLAFPSKESDPWILHGDCKDLREAPFGFHFVPFTLPTLG